MIRPEPITIDGRSGTVVFLDAKREPVDPEDPTAVLARAVFDDGGTATYFVEPRSTDLSDLFLLWDEALHPRDEGGKFAESDSSAAKAFAGDEGFEWHEAQERQDYALALPKPDVDAINDYAGFGYADMNAHLRGTFTPRIVDETVREATPEEIAAYQFPPMGQGHHASDYKEDDPLNKVADGRIAHTFHYKGGYKQDGPNERVDTYTIERAGPDTKYVKGLETKSAQIDESIRERGYELPEPMVVNRAAYLPGKSLEDLQAMEGKVIEEKGFTSTMVGNPNNRLDSYVMGAKHESIYKRTGGKAVESTEVGSAMRIKIVLPAGTKVAAVEPVRRMEFQYKRDPDTGLRDLQNPTGRKIDTGKDARREAEILLGTGAQFRITRVSQAPPLKSYDGSLQPVDVVDVEMEYIGGGSSEGS